MAFGEVSASGWGSVVLRSRREVSLCILHARRTGIPGLRGSGKPVFLLRTLTSLAGKSWTLVGMVVWKVETLRRWLR